MSDSASRPTDAWLGAFTQMPGGHFGMLVKPRVPVWRPRPLFANRIAFMTTFAEPGSTATATAHSRAGRTGLARERPECPAARPSVARSRATALRRGPDRDADGRPLWLATPSPCPPAHVLLAGAPVVAGAAAPEPGAYGLYLARDDWPEGAAPADAAAIDLKLLFDDPDLVDAEPVAVYARGFTPREPPKESPGRATPPESLALANGQVYRGPMGQVFATAIDSPTHDGRPARSTDRRRRRADLQRAAGRRHRPPADLRRPPRPVR